MGTSARRLLALYLAALFLSLPLLPEVVISVTDRLGRGFVYASLTLLLVLCGLLPALMLLLPPRPKPPWPHLSYAGLAAGALMTVKVLASSPIGRIHLVEYALLAVLILRALPGPRGWAQYGAALSLSALVGIADETVQHFLPTRVFDPYDIALNVAASALGVCAAAWWTWTARMREA